MQVERWVPSSWLLSSRDAVTWAVGTQNTSDTKMRGFYSWDQFWNQLCVLWFISDADYTDSTASMAQSHKTASVASVPRIRSPGGLHFCPHPPSLPLSGWLFAKMAHKPQTLHLGLLLYYKDTSQNSQVEELQSQGVGGRAQSPRACSGCVTQHPEALCSGVLYGVFIMRVGLIKWSMTGDWTQVQLFSPPW